MESENITANSTEVQTPAEPANDSQTEEESKGTAVVEEDEGKVVS